MAKETLLHPEEGVRIRVEGGVRSPLVEVDGGEISAGEVLYCTRPVCRVTGPKGSLVAYGSVEEHGFPVLAVDFRPADGGSGAFYETADDEERYIKTRVASRQGLIVTLADDGDLPMEEYRVTAKRRECDNFVTMHTSVHRSHLNAIEEASRIVLKEQPLEEGHKVRRLLSDLGDYTFVTVEDWCWLVSVDKLEKVPSEEEVVVLEESSLGGVDVVLVTLEFRVGSRYRKLVRSCMSCDPISGESAWKPVYAFESMAEAGAAMLEYQRLLKDYPGMPIWEEIEAVKLEKCGRCDGWHREGYDGECGDESEKFREPEF